MGFATSRPNGDALVLALIPWEVLNEKENYEKTDSCPSHVSKLTSNCRILRQERLNAH
jgi:hypothetical protein